MTGQLLFLDIDTSALDGLPGLIEKEAAEAISEGAALLFNRIRTRYLQQVDPDGIPWQPSEAALMRKKQGRGGGTLFDTGTLFHSIQLYSISPLEMQIGTDVPYGIYHQEGTIHLPVRQFLGFSLEDADLMNDVMIRRIEELL
jgi:phage gpG-like protein